MGRGVAYPYEYFMLYDDQFFVFQPENEGKPVGDPEWDEDDYGEFKREIAEAFGAWMLGRPDWQGNETNIFAETSRLRIGIDSSGGGPCLFVVPRCYEHTFTREEIPYVIDREVVRGFNRMVNTYPNLWSRATGPWTSENIEGRYRRAA